MISTSHEEGSRFCDNNCDAHLMIDEVSIENEAVKCKCTILGATDRAQVGRPVTEWVKYSGKAAGMLLNLAEATGIITADQRRAAHDAGVGLDIDETQLKGRQFCAKIRLERAQRKNLTSGAYEDDPEKPNAFARFGFNSFGVWDQKAAGIPLDMQFASMVPKPAGWTQQAAQPAAGQTAPMQPRPTQPTQPAAQLTQPTQQSAVVADMNW